MPDRIISKLRNIYSGDLSSFGGVAIDEVVSGRVRAEQLNIILYYLPSIMLANVCNALIFVVAVWPSPNRPLSLVWAATIVCYAIFYGIKGRRKPFKPQSVSAHSIQRVVRNALLLGSLWAALPLLFFIGASAGGQLIITCLCAGMLAGGAFAFASVPVAAIAFTSPIFIASAVVIARSGDQAYFLVAMLMVVYTCVLIRGVFVHALQLTKRLAEQVQAEEQAHKDFLTKLPNRMSFNEDIEAALSRLKRGGEQFAVLYLDLDEFKSVNDRLGHGAGDELLVQVASRLKSCARASDSVARLGGDEFAIIANAINSSEQALAFAERLVETFSLPFMIDGSTVYNTVSIGIAIAPSAGVSSDVLMKNTDTALYRAKGEVGGSVQIFEPRHDAKARERRAIEHDLRLALARDEFFLVFQPFFDLAQNRLTGCEALLRWRHPLRGIIFPEEFIQIAEATELIHPIGEWVIREACRAASDWPQDTKIAINFSAVQFRKASILPAIIKSLADVGVSPSRLEIEITESTILSENDFALSMLNNLLDLGTKFALDDFGTGYASLSCLRKFPFDRIKIDCSFVREMLTDPHCASIVRSVIGLAHDLGIGVTAEGVETEEQLSYLRATTCGQVQGFLISEPKPAAEIAALFGKTKTSHTLAA
jgi:diguanylate cyclase (GGDEF)-like protein